MKNTYTATQQKELFAKDCKLINLKYEYTGYIGQEKWAIVSELSEQELFEKYPDEVKKYIPFVLLSVEQGKAIQAYNRNEDKYRKPTVIVAAVTSVIKKRYLPSHIILGDKFGLKKPSMVLLEQVQTVNKDELSDYIGTIEDEHLLRQINATLKKTFGLWVYKPEKEENVRCLCTKCLNDYIHNPDYIVRRLDPFAKVKDHCDKCNQSGWDYVVTKRNYKK